MIIRKETDLLPQHLRKWVFERKEELWETNLNKSLCSREAVGALDCFCKLSITVLFELKDHSSFLINLITMTSHHAFQGVISGLKDKPCMGSHQQPHHEISPTLKEKGLPPCMQICRQFLLTLWKIAVWEVNICLDLTSLCHRSTSHVDVVHMCEYLCMQILLWHNADVSGHASGVRREGVICYHIFDRLHLCGLSVEVWQGNLILMCLIFSTELNALEKNYMDGVLLSKEYQWSDTWFFHIIMHSWAGHRNLLLFGLFVQPEAKILK